MGKERVAVALSGGKDSTTAILVLKKQGFDVLALTMAMGLRGEEERIGKIALLAEVLEVPHRVVDVGKIFKEKVIDYFIHAYAAGLTPNPCVVCNNTIKFDLLMNHAFDQAQCDFYATGHYADKVEIEGRFFLKEPLDWSKSQIYFLSLIDSRCLERTLFPLAQLTLLQVRRQVSALPLANRSESQEACFLEGRCLIDYLREQMPGSFMDGDILDTAGKKIGTHHGAIHFTIGQRRGIEFSSSQRLYVVRKDMKNNTITLGQNRHLYSKQLFVKNPVFWRPLQPGEKLHVKVRYVCTFFEAVIESVAEDHIQARFSEPVRAVTPGQIAAFYDDDIIVAGGVIQE